jgi:hypothetical protein
MRSKWTCAAITFVLLAGCVSQPAYVPKTDEQIAQEALDKTVADMKQRGASQAEIDRMITHSKLSYEDQLKSYISPISTPAENLVELIDRGLFYCDLQRSSLKIPITYEYTIKTERKLVECISTSSRVISSYYYKSYVPSTSSDAVKGAVDETYLKWSSYGDSIFKSAPSYLQDQASMAVKDQVNRSEQVFLRETQKNKK